jgi:NAD(P)-dependent dehydrogenase (short-subunit alcohol dehydrogenase family)
MQPWILITGANSGIGADAARYLHERGFGIIACMRKIPAGAPALPRFHRLALDVTKPDTIAAARAAVEKLDLGGGPFHLLNNAGIAVAGPVEGLSDERWREQFDVNVFGLLAVTRAFLPFVRKTKGRVVNVSSISGIFASPYLGAYAASKFAVEALTDALRREVMSAGIEVSLIEPGPIATPIWEKNLKEKDALLASFGPEIHAHYAADMDRFAAVVEESAKHALPVVKVSEAIHRALTAKKPKARYPVLARAAVWQIALIRRLPGRMVDRLVMKGFGRDL